MKTKGTALIVAVLLCMAPGAGQDASAQDYVGSSSCINCHSQIHPDLVAEYEKTGHPYKLNPVAGMPPLYPAHTSPGVSAPPPNTTWDQFAYVIGGYGWKARFVKTDGRVYTTGDSAQYNLGNEGWVAYHKGENKKYDFGCFQCHTTGASAEGSWNGVPEDSLGTFSEPGIRCEGCHGPGSEHAANPTEVNPPIQGLDLTLNRCGTCHQRGGATNAIPASGLFVRHHEQLNEMLASRHGDGLGADLSCASCHDAHVALRYPEAAGAGMAGITTTCQTCHPNYEVQLDGAPKPIDCVDCHMAPATKSALGLQAGNGWRGDVKTHIWGINTMAVTREAMFTQDGARVALDAEGLAAVTLDFACLACHTDKDVSWAASFAQGIHETGIVTDVQTVADVPAAFRLDQNYPNPFNPSTTIAFALPNTSAVTLRLYDLNGRLMATLLEGKMPPGYHTVTLNVPLLASGVYLYELRAGDFVEAKKMTLLR